MLNHNKFLTASGRTEAIHSTGTRMWCFCITRDSSAEEQKELRQKNQRPRQASLQQPDVSKDAKSHKNNNFTHSQLAESQCQCLLQCTSALQFWLLHWQWGSSYSYLKLLAALKKHLPCYFTVSMQRDPCTKQIWQSMQEWRGRNTGIKGSFATSFHHCIRICQSKKYSHVRASRAQQQKSNSFSPYIYSDAHCASTHKPQSDQRAHQKIAAHSPCLRSLFPVSWFWLG